MACIAFSATSWADEAAELAAVAKAVQGLAGSRAVNVTAELKGAHAVAVVSLLKGGKSSSVSEPLE